MLKSIPDIGHTASPPSPAPSFRKSLRNAHINYRYVLRHADEIWVGDISPNGMLNAMITGLKGDRP